LVNVARVQPARLHTAAFPAGVEAPSSVAVRFRCPASLAARQPPDLRPRVDRDPLRRRRAVEIHRARQVNSCGNLNGSATLGEKTGFSDCCRPVTLASDSCVGPGTTRRVHAKPMQAPQVRRTTNPLMLLQGRGSSSGRQTEGLEASETDAPALMAHAHPGLAPLREKISFYDGTHRAPSAGTRVSGLGRLSSFGVPALFFEREVRKRLTHFHRYKCRTPAGRFTCLLGIGAANYGLPTQSPSKHRTSTETKGRLAEGDLGTSSVLRA
jgi:hypothetical protein